MKEKPVCIVSDPPPPLPPLRPQPPPHLRTLLLSKLSILPLPHQPLPLPPLPDLNPSNPPLRLRSLINHPRFLPQHLINLDHSPTNRGQDIARTFHRLDRGDGVARGDGERWRGQLDVDDIAEILGRVARDAYGARFAVRGQFEPFMVFGVFFL